MTTRTTKRSAGVPTWFDLATPNLEGAKAFYQQIFGWDYFDTGADFGNYNMAMSQGRNVAGIGPIFPPDSPQPSAWTVYFASDNAQADVERVKALGGSVMMEPMAVGDSGSLAICVDPTGAVFGFWQANQHIGSGAENEHGAMAWCEVNTRESVKASEFYSKLLNLSMQKAEMGGTDYYFMQRDQEMFAGILQMDHHWEGIPPHWMNYFAVDNTDAAIDRAIAAGGKVQVPAFDMQYGRMAVLDDPYGATFSIIQLANS